MRIVTFVLIILITALQWPMWLGKGSWYQVWKIDDRLVKQRTINKDLMRRNSALAAEVADLKNGTDAIEEQARSELGMVKQDEVFFQILEKK